MLEGTDIGGFVRIEVIAKIFDLTARRIQQLTQDGTLNTVQTPEGRRYDLVPTMQKYYQFLSDKAKGKAKNETEDKLKMQKLKADIALKESQGELHRLKTDIAAGKYISVEEIKMDYDRFFVSFKKFAMTIPNRLAGRLNGFVEPVEVRRLEQDMQKDVAKLLGSFVLSAVVDDDNGKITEN